MSCLQLIINPGSTSTKLAIYDGTEKKLQYSLDHNKEDLLQFEQIADQVPYRLALIRDFMAQNGIKPSDLSAVVGRGGLVFGLTTGGYVVDDNLCTALVDHRWSQPHASNLGGLLAKQIADEAGIAAFKGAGQAHRGHEPHRHAPGRRLLCLCPGARTHH